MKHKLFTFILALTASVGTLFAESGTCGENVTWNLTDGTLTISGTGNMTNYSSYSSVPWYSSRSDIKIVNIGDGVTSITGAAFYGCSSLTSIDIPNSVTDIGNGAFYNCSSLTSVTIPNSVTSIGNSAFSGCSGLTSVTIGNSVTNIGEFAFSGCSGLTSVVIPNSVTGIGEYAFYGCSGLISIVVEDGNTRYDSRDNCNAIIETSKNTLKVGCQTTIIPNSVTTIGRGAFNGCSSLTSIEIPNSVTKIEGSFYGCSGLTSINVASDNPKYCSVNGVLFNKDQTELITFPSGKQETSYTIPNSVKKIGEGAFDGCSGLTSVTIPNSVTSISGSAFYGCSNLKYVLSYIEVPPTIDYITFSSDMIVYVPNTSISSYKSAYGWKSVNIRGFCGAEISNAPTSVSLDLYYILWDIENKSIASVGIEGSEQQAGNVLEYIGLEPESEYKDIPVVMTSNTGVTETVNVSFTTTALELTTKPSKTVSATTAILLAETNMADAEVSCGFEYKRNDAPEDMAGTKVFCPVANGQMAGRLKNLKDDVYYKYRAFYQSAAGKMYYGDWQYIFTGDVAVAFDPVIYTYAASAVTEHEATLKGYALEGSDDFTEQGFEVWADSRKPHNAKPALNYKSQLGEKQTFAATGIAMKVTLTDLDPGTVYKYRTYAKFGEQTVYGSEMSFTTQGEWVAYKVTFVDKDGNTIAVREVEPGDDAVAPEAPEVEGYRFTGWDVDFTNVQSDLTVTAQYTEIVMVTLVVQAQDPAMGTVTGGGEYAQGIKVKITAVPNEGYVFVMWNDGNTDNPRTVTAADKTYTAVFEQQPQAIDQTQAAQSDNRKVLRNGQLYILRGDKTYNVTGQEMR